MTRRRSVTRMLGSNIGRRAFSRGERGLGIFLYAELGLESMQLGEKFGVMDY
jgi:hypothetical protein